MIRIQEHLNRDDAEVFLDTLAEKHWGTLNQNLASGKGLKQNSLIEKCRKYKAQTKRKSYIVKYAGGDPQAAERQKTFFDFLLSAKATNLKRLIIARPLEFSSLKAEIYGILHPSDLYSGSPGNCAQSPFGVLLSNVIFNYTAFRASDFCKDLFSEINFQSTTCPYCNDNKLNITKLKSNSSSKTKLKAYLDLDHFYSKSEHPYFSISFFNLLPVCHDCNSGDKGEKPFTIETHIHPYCDSFDDYYKFSISLTTLLGDPIDSIDIHKTNRRPHDITLTDLNLRARYANNFAAANELVNLFWKNKEHIGTEFENDFRELLLRDIPVERHNILKHQRAKMNRDILMQIDIGNVLNLL